MPEAVLDPAAVADFRGQLLPPCDKYERLVPVKDRYDPHNVFLSNTNIPPSA